MQCYFSGKGEENSLQFCLLRVALLRDCERICWVSKIFWVNENALSQPEKEWKESTELIGASAVLTKGPEREQVCILMRRAAASRAWRPIRDGIQGKRRLEQVWGASGWLVFTAPSQRMHQAGLWGPAAFMREAFVPSRAPVMACQPLKCPFMC